MQHYRLQFWVFALILIVPAFHTAAAPLPDEAVVDAIESTLPAAREIKDQGQRERSLEQLSTALARLGRLDEALTAARNPEVRDEVLRLTVRRQAAAGQVEQATLAAARINGSLSRVDAFFAITRAHLRQKNLDLARNTPDQAVPL